MIEDDHDPDAWLKRAACRGMDPALFFPERGEPVAPMRAACDACLVRVDCLAQSLVAQEQVGCWGGFTSRERRRLRKLLRAAPTYAERLPEDAEPEHPVTIRTDEGVTSDA